MSIFTSIKHALGIDLPIQDRASLANANAALATGMFDKAADLLEGAAELQDLLAVEASDVGESLTTAAEHAFDTSDALNEAAYENRNKAKKVRDFFAVTEA